MKPTLLREAQRAIEAIPSLARPPVYFPDLTYKEKTEAPASIAVATRGTIIPTLTAPSLGCSMGLISTSLTERDVGEKFYNELFGHLPDETGERYGLFYNLLRLVGLKRREKKKYDLSYGELENVLGGKEDLNLRGIVPKPAWIYGRHDIGYGFKGNHFVEVQAVQDILNTEVAERLGIKRGQIMIMYHGGGGTVPYYLGRFFGNRRKNTTRQRIVVGIGKIFFHLFSRDVFKRLRYYFFPHKHEAIPLDSREGKRLMTAIKVAENYSAHWNTTMCRRIIDAFHKTTAGKNVQADLVVAKIHNTIREEGGLVVHRHTVNRVHSGELTIISGSKTEPSYLAVGGSNTAQYLNSVDHGTGGNESVITTLIERGIIKQVARLKPLKTFKQ